jgi:hypothetical protein
MNSELDKNGKDTVVLDWFRPPESKTLRPVWWDYVEGEVPSNGALGALYGRQARASIRGRWTLIGAGYRFRSSPSVITERISRSSGLQAAPPPWSKGRLAPQDW